MQAIHTLATSCSAPLIATVSGLVHFTTFSRAAWGGQVAFSLRCAITDLGLIVDKSVSPMGSYKYIVLGGGNSSGYAALEFVNQGIAKGELLIITDEPVVAYERPALSKAYLFPEGAARLPGFHTTVGGGGSRQELSWYTDHGIEYKLSTTVVAASFAGKSLTTDVGEVFNYEKLIIATGARPINLKEFKMPGADLDGVFYLRNVSDADNLLDGLAKLKAAKGRAVCIGGGYIGMEAAASLCLHGIDVEVIFPEEYLFQRLLTPPLRDFYEKVYTDKGIKLRPHSSAVGFEGENGKVTAVLLKDGTRIPAGLVVVGVGARPNSELFAGQLTMERGGIIVDLTLRTSDPDVYAIGDVAAFPLKLYGSPPQRQEHVTNARLTAAHAVKAIFGSTEEYDYLPYFYSRVFNLSWVFYGANEGEYIHFTTDSPNKLGGYWVHNGKVVGAFLESGSADEVNALKALARSQPPAPAAEVLSSQGIGFATALL